MAKLWAATRKGLFSIERNGGWRISSASFLADNVSMMLPDERDGSLYAALGHGHFGCKLHRSRDGGKSWQACGVPVYPPVPEGHAPEVNPHTGKVTPWSLELVWSLEMGGTDEPGVLWCGTIPGGLFRSADGGDSWHLMESLWNDPTRTKWFGGGMDYAGIHSICVDPRDSKHVSVAISCAGVWITRDGGKTWAICGKGMRAEYMPPEMAMEPVAQDPHRLVQCPAAPDSMWVQHHNGIFASENGGDSWREIENVRPSGFGFAVAVHPGDPKTAWFVPGIKDEKRIPPEGKVVVTRTKDGGRSFDVLSRGLPGEYAYDLVYRHCLDVDSSGDVLAFASTTGSLWISEDGGDSWETVSTHLPPVYCVRFEK
jgi:photosystem II stability/assembly factor-like uncharacterized protein